MLFMNRHTKRRTEVRFIMKKIVKTIIMILLMVAVGAVHAYGQWKQPVYDTTVVRLAGQQRLSRNLRQSITE